MLSALANPDDVIFGLLGMILLGVWQLVSAAIYTSRLQRANKKPLLKTYWKIAGITLIMLFPCFFIEGTSNIFSIIFIASIAAGFATAVYYLYVYKTYLFNYE